MISALRRHRLLLVVAALCIVILVGAVTVSRPDPSALTAGRDRARPAQDRLVQQPAVGRANALDFAGAAVTALHSYDTRTARERWRHRLLATLGTPDGSAGARDADRLIPDAAQWAQMARVGQRASAIVDSAYVPALWTRTAREHPGLPDGAVGVTVTGTQSLAWDGGTSRVPVAATVLLLCPPATKRCVVSRILARVAR